MLLTRKWNVLTLSLMAVFSTVAYADETNTKVSGSLKKGLISSSLLI